MCFPRARTHANANQPRLGSGPIRRCSFVFRGCTFTFSRDSVPVRVGGARCQTRPVVQRRLRVHAGVTVVGLGAVAQSAVRVATQTLPPLLVLEEPLGTVRHTQSLVQKVILFTACRRRTAISAAWDEMFTANYSKENKMVQRRNEPEAGGNVPALVL